MHRGYVKVWRKIEDAGWLKNHKLCSFWLWCLMKASHKELDQIIGFQKIHLMPGDFIFGRKICSKELRMSERSIRTILEFLKTSENLTIKTTNKFSIISIVNWNAYQKDNITTDHQNDQPPTSNRPATDHKQEYKELKNNIYTPNFLKFYSAYPNKKEKAEAFKRWKKLNGTLPPVEDLISAINRQIEWRKNANGEFRPEWKHPATWLNKGCWDDEVEKKEKKSSW